MYVKLSSSNPLNTANMKFGTLENLQPLPMHTSAFASQLLLDLSKQIHDLPYDAYDWGNEFLLTPFGGVQTLF
jgi:hypothetical protein